MTLFTGHSEYKNNWADTAIEPMLSGVGVPSIRTPSSIREAAMSARDTPECIGPWESEGFRVGVELPDEEIEWSGFGVGTPSDSETTSIDNLEAGCSTVLTLDDSVLDCDSNTGWCEGERYLKRTSLGDASAAAASVPEDLGNVPHPNRSGTQRRSSPACNH